MIVGEYPKIAEEIDTVHVRSFYSRQIFEFLFFQHDSHLLASRLPFPVRLGTNSCVRKYGMEGRSAFA